MRKIYLLLLSLLLLPYGMRAQEEAYPSTVTVSFSQNGQTVTSVPYGSTVTITATMEKAETAANALSADAGKVDFYLGDANDTGMKMGTGTVEFEGDAYTASVDVTIDQDKGFNNAGTFKFSADFGGYAPEGDEGGDSLAPNTGSAELTVTKASQEAPATGVGYTINFTAETITANEDCELAAESTATTGGKTLNVTPGTPVYVRKAGTDTHNPSAWTAVAIPARPAAPTDLNLMDYTDVSVTYYVGEGVQCRLGNEGDWVTLGQNETDYTFTGLTPQTTYTVYARNPATESQFASAEATDEVTTKSSAAEAPEMTYEVTANSITLSYSVPWQYQTSDDEWISVEGSKEFTSLEAATEYTFTVRVAESETAEASKVGTVKVYTAHAAPAANEGYAINYATETLTVNDGYEVNTAEDFTGTAIQSGASLSDYIDNTLYIRHEATENGAPASAAVVLEIPARPAAPSGLTATEETCIDGKDGKITGVTTDMEYKLSTADVWIDCTDIEITGLAPGTYQVRLAATETDFAGEVASITIEEVVEIQIDKSESAIELGSEGVVLTATITGIDDVNKAENWKWESSNKDIVEVNRLTPEAPTTRSADNPIESTARVTPGGEGTATITVTYTGTKYTATKTYDITVKAKEEEPDPQPQPDPTPLYYNIQFEEVCEGVDASLSKSVVKAGNQVSVYIEVEEGYDAKNLKVMCKQSLYGYWEEVEEGVQPGEYIIYNVYNDIYVKVEGVEKIEEDPTGMSDIEGTKVYAQNGSLYVYTSQLKEVAIITMGGTVLRRERQEGLRSYSLPKGVYIICIGEETFKVRN